MGVLVQDYIEVYNLLGTRLAIINEAYNIHIEYESNSWPVLRFSVPKKSTKWIYLKEENRVKYYGLYYVIKRTNAKMDLKNIKYQEIECPSIGSDLNYKYNQVLGSYSDNELIPTVQNVEGFLDLVLANTGWSRGTTDIPSGTYRTFQSEWQTVPTNLLEGKEKFKAFLVYNPDTLTIDLLEEPGQDNGVVIQYAKNMQEIERELTSEEIVTRLYLYGDEDLTVNEINLINPGQSYIENFTYFLGLGYTQQQIDDDIALNGEASAFVKVGQHKAPDYVDPTPLYEDGISKLAELCIPKASYRVKLLDLSRISGKSPESFNLYDWITVINEDLNIDIKARIVRIDYYPRFPEKTEIDISNIFDNLGSVLNKTIQIGDVIRKNTSASNLLKHIISTFSTTINSANGKLTWTDSTLDAIEIDEFGDPTGKIVRITPGGIGISEDGGATFVTALTGDGVLANTIYANAIHILGIGANGITIAEGDNGVALNASEGLVVTRADKFVQSVLNATIGIQIRQGDGTGGNWLPVFSADENGNLSLSGSIQALEFKNLNGDSILTGDKLKIHGAFIEELVANTITSGTLLLKEGMIITNAEGTIIMDGNSITIRDADGTTTIIDAHGLNGGLTYLFKNMAHNSSFEVYDVSSLDVRFCTGGEYSDDSSMFDSGSLKIGVGLSVVYTPEVDNKGLINSNWYAAEASRTICSLYRKGGSLKIEMLKHHSSDTPYTLNPDTTPVSYITLPTQSNWGDSRYTFNFAHESAGTATDIRYKLTSMDSTPVYVDGISIEPELRKGHPSAYHDGPNSLANSIGELLSESSNIQIGDEYSGTPKLNSLFIDTDAELWGSVFVSSLKMSGSGPSYSNILGNLYCMNFDSATPESLDFCIQIPTTYFPGSAIKPYVLWTPTDSGSGDVRWSLEYIIVDIEDAFPGSTTTVSGTSSRSGTGKAAVKVDLSSIDAVGIKERGLILCRLTRNADNGLDTYAADAALIGVGFNIYLQKPGSEVEF